MAVADTMQVKVYTCITCKSIITVVLIYLWQLYMQFKESQFQLRSRSAHDTYCQNLSGPARSHYAITYGVTHISILNNSKYFHVVDGMAPDVMHDILEGAIQLEINLLIRKLISSGYTTIKTINSRITGFCYGPVDTINRPTPLVDRVSASESIVKQSGI